MLVRRTLVIVALIAEGQMLEDIALRYIGQSEDNLRLLAYGIVVVGAIFAGLFHRSNTLLRRAPYFAYTGLLLLLSAAAQLVWLGSLPAMTGGYLWVFMLVDLVAGLAIGYAFAVIAMGRSRDAYGHARMAVLAFIPLANLWLLGTPSKSELAPNRAPTMPVLSGAMGVLTGFILLGGYVALVAFGRVETSRIWAEAESDPAMQQAGIAVMLRSQGLEATLRLIAAEVPTLRVDETTTLRRVEGDGTTLRYLYDVSVDVDALPIALRTSLVQHNCTHQALRPLIEAGATIEHVYMRLDGSEIGTVTIARNICGF